MPKSRSGPCRVIRTFEPTPATPAQEYVRLLQKRALIEDRIASRETIVNNPHTLKRRTVLSSSKQLQRLYEERKTLQLALSRFGE